MYSGCKLSAYLRGEMCFPESNWWTGYLSRGPFELKVFMTLYSEALPSLDAQRRAEQGVVQEHRDQSSTPGSVPVKGRP